VSSRIIVAALLFALGLNPCTGERASLYVRSDADGLFQARHIPCGAVTLGSLQIGGSLGGLYEARTQWLGQLSGDE